MVLWRRISGVLSPLKGGLGAITGLLQGCGETGEDDRGEEGVVLARIFLEGGRLVRTREAELRGEGEDRRRKKPEEVEGWIILKGVEEERKKGEKGK